MPWSARRSARRPVQSWIGDGHAGNGAAIGAGTGLIGSAAGSNQSGYSS